MSGNEKDSGNMFETFDLTKGELKAFFDTGYQGADELKKLYTAWDKAGAGDDVAQQFIKNPGGAIQKQFDDFMSWQQKNNKTKQEHEEYVKASQDKPGRSATILTPPESKTVLA